MTERRTISKYPNRRLYDPAQGRYITLEDIRALVTGHVDFVVIDKKTGADIKKVANPSALARLARQEGMSPEELCDHIAQALPGLVDKATPDGQVPRQQGKPAQERKGHKK